MSRYVLFEWESTWIMDNVDRYDSLTHAKSVIRLIKNRYLTEAITAFLENPIGRNREEIIKFYKCC